MTVYSVFKVQSQLFVAVIKLYNLFPFSNTAKLVGFTLPIW